ncbi:SDR family oxidoreductase [Kribbella capetownensis]|uniref:SDR family oxidoreductase n=1 Tax=Kribbella capetownensis TaxID=1572659 RepID=A0A4R0K555_9ACTN|nr:SDR family oxidoreductase [Kribbella capetownensis]TCC53056.1 SDR family oxidoreductase [Kribbella capetownensis]
MDTRNEQLQQVALVTGANKGIGLAVAEGLLRLGMTVFLGARDISRGTAAVAALAAQGLDARGVQLDVTDQASIDAAADLIARDAGALDILVNNAGIVVSHARPSETSIEELRRTYETNVFGVVAVTNAVLPLLRRSSSARIVNLTSDLGSLALAAGDEDFPPLLSYNSSKTALNAVTVAYANELRAEGILVNAVSPGSVATDQNGHAGLLTTEQGARLPIRMATLPAGGPTGSAVTAGEDLSEHPLAW